MKRERRVVEQHWHDGEDNILFAARIFRMQIIDDYIFRARASNVPGSRQVNDDNAANARTQITFRSQFTIRMALASHDRCRTLPIIIEG